MRNFAKKKVPAAASHVAEGRSSNTQLIARNSFWYGSELVFAIVAAFATSIPLARVIGPYRLGYFSYISWLTSMSGVIGSLGMAGATRKYMAEYLNRGLGGSARAVFFATMRLQALITVALTAVALVLVYTVSNPAYHTISAFLVLSMLPAVFVGIPASANMAAENMRANALASLASYVVQIVSVALSLSLGWDLIGVAIGVFAFRCVDCGIKLWSVLVWVRKLPDEPLPTELRNKLINFSSYNFVLLLLNVIVWDRSDVIFLKALNPNIAQLSFYTVAFNLTEKVRLLPNAVGTAMGSSIQAQFGRDASRVPQITAAALWYTFLCGLPLMVGMAALSGHLIPLLYGRSYLPAIPVLVVAALFAIPKCYLPAWNLLEAMEKQRFLALWMCSCAVANILLDVWLIPGHGALGAAVANGVAQFIAVAGVIAKARSLCDLRFRVTSALGASVASALMALTIVGISMLWSGWFILPVQICLGAIVFFAALRLISVFTPEDRERVMLLRRSVPAPFRRVFDSSVMLLMPQYVQELAG
jgi:O-antigen/teichoic acid export membrane protein